MFTNAGSGTVTNNPYLPGDPSPAVNAPHDVTNTSLGQNGLPTFLNFESSQDHRHHARRLRPASSSAPPTIEVPFWDDDPEAWDSIGIGDYFFRGTCTIGGTPSKLKTDDRSAPGSDGSTLISKGYDPAKVTITLRLWTREHLADFSAIIPRLHPKRDPRARNAVAVYHPTLALAQIHSVVVVQPGFLVPDGGVSGLYTCALECIEYTPPSAANVTSRATSAASASARNTFNPDLDQDFDSSQARDAPANIPAPSTTNAGPT